MSDSEGFGTSMGCLLLIAVLGFAVYGAVAAYRKAVHPPAPDYSKGRYRGVETLIVTPNDDRKISISLRTSWIPGSKDSGTMRYVVYIYPATPDKDPLLNSLFMSRIGLCTFSINLIDKSGFKLDTIDLKPARIVDSDQNVTELEDSDMMSMSREEYESIGPDGNWQPRWICP